ncbi:DUF2071 domain-containing protein [Roseibacillus persicicus]|uniref:YqjF family protein n=1 Tax=Roseibacillus persicicus TaxID=454148 RepID=UPI00398B2A35
MFQRWSHLLFLHWEVPSDLLNPHLPEGLHLDTFDGKAYLGIVPFFMQKIRPRFLPCVPGLSWFLELNLRTYVYDEQGRPGVWFFSLDANQALAVTLARTLFHLPYQDARMTATNRDGEVDFSCQRKGMDELARYQYRAKGSSLTAASGTLEYFLLERYYLFSTTAKGELKIGQVHHRPYPFHQAACETVSMAPMGWNQFSVAECAPVSALYSPGVDVEIFGLKVASRTR